MIEPPGWWRPYSWDHEREIRDSRGAGPPQPDLSTWEGRQAAKHWHPKPPPIQGPTVFDIAYGTIVAELGPEHFAPLPPADANETDLLCPVCWSRAVHWMGNTASPRLLCRHTQRPCSCSCHIGEVWLAG